MDHVQVQLLIVLLEDKGGEILQIVETDRKYIASDFKQQLVGPTSWHLWNTILPKKTFLRGKVMG